MLTFNCETWTCISNKTFKILDNLFYTFCRIISRVGVSCPIGSFFIQTGSLRFCNLILERHLNFLYHLAHLPVTSLRRQILEEQITYSLPGLFQQNEQFIQDLGYNNFREMTKKQWSKKVKEFVFNKNRGEVLDSIRGSKKLDFEKLSSEKYEKKSYLNELDLESARILFRFHSKLIPTVRKNFSSQYRRKGVSLTCPSCSKLSLPSSPELPTMMSSSNSLSMSSSTPPLHSQSHLLTSCEAVKDIRDECMPFADDQSLAEFFRLVVARHLEMGEE